jgi:hypothetical protein
VGLEGDSADVSVEEGVCAPAVELDLSAEELFAVILRPLFFRTILSHLENYSSPAKLPIRTTLFSVVVTVSPPCWIIKGKNRYLCLLRIGSLFVILSLFK